MTRSVVTVTDTWTQISAVACSIVRGEGLGHQIHVNETATDVAALTTVMAEDTLVVQNETKDTFVRKNVGDLDTVTLILDEV